MNCCLSTIINCCEALTSTPEEFIKALEKCSGLTKVGMVKNKRAAQIIYKRERLT